MRIASIVLNDMQADARVARFARTLAAAGHEVGVFALMAKGTPREEHRDGYGIFRVAGYTTAPWSRPFAKMRQQRDRENALVDSILAWSPDAVHCNDLDTLGAGCRIKERTGCKLIYDAHELFGDMLASDREGSTKLLVAYWNRQERILAPLADRIVTVSESAAHEISKRTGCAVQVIANVPDLEEPCAPASFDPSQEGIIDSLVVLYQGRIGHGRALIPLVKSLAEVRSAILVLQGPVDGSYLERLLGEAEMCGVKDRVEYIGVAPQNELHEACCASDVGFVALEDTSLNNAVALPNKLMQYLMAGLPVVGSSKLIESTRFIEENEVGLLCDPADPHAIAAALRRLGDPALRKRFSHNGRLLAVNRYNWDREQERLITLYEDLAREGR